MRSVHPSDAQNDHDEDRDKENAEDQRSKCHNADFLFVAAPGMDALPTIVTGKLFPWRNMGHRKRCSTAIAIILLLHTHIKSDLPTMAYAFRCSLAA